MTDRELHREIVAALGEGVIVVEFTKRDGTVRRMRCTLQEGVVPKAAFDMNDYNDYDLITVWDVDRGAWRSFSVHRMLPRPGAFTKED